MRFKNQVVIITGSSRGIGAATAKQFASQGAKVIINSKDTADKGHKIAKEIGDNASYIQADLTKETDVKQLMASTVEHFGQLDIVVNNAGEIIRPGDWQSDLNTWHKTLDANLTSAWLTIKHAAPHLKKSTKPAIVNVVSVYGFLGGAPVAAYTSAKAGLITLTKSMAKELAPEIRVNAVAPSNVMTDMTKGAGDELIAYFVDQTPLKRVAEPEEIANAVTFLASDDASYITGEMLVVDGGYSLK